MTDRPNKTGSPVCWCGGRDLSEFSPDYGICNHCGTLVRLVLPTEDLTDVSDADSDLYGRGYYEKHLVHDLGQPEIMARMRQDLPERTLHWLRTVQKYCPTGGRVLEIGCGHGAALALFEASGYKATGLELSPWLVELARDTWGVDVRCGPVERQNFEDASFDVIALFDVLEHLQNPILTLQICERLLKPDGVLIIQTPEHRPDRTFAEIINQNHPFKLLLIPEHLYLFTRDSARRLLKQAGLPEVIFERAMFDHYDQYFVASKEVPKTVSIENIEKGMTTSVSGRLTQALLDLKDQTAAALEDSSLVRELGRTIQKLNRDLLSLDAQRLTLDETARGLQTTLEENAKSAAKQRADLESQISQNRILIESLDQQLTLLNSEAKTTIAEKEGVLAEAERQRGELVEMLLSRESKIEELDSQLRQVNAIARSQAEEATENTIALAQNQRAIEALDQQLTLLNSEAKTTIAEKECVLAEAERQRAELVEMLLSRESQIEDLDAQLRQVNEIARSQADEASANTIALTQKLDSQTKAMSCLEAELTSLKLEAEEANSTRVDYSSLRRAHVETSLANRLLSGLTLTRNVAASWTYFPLAFDLLPCSPEAVLQNLEVSERNYDTIRISGWAWANDSDFKSAPPLMLLNGTPFIWTLTGQAVDRPDVIEAFPASKDRPAPHLACGFVFEFPTNRIPDGASHEIRICFGLIGERPCLTNPLVLPS